MADPFTTARSSYPTTMPRTTRDLETDFSRMNDINYLRYRNAELETELRLVKQQLDEAHISTQYLVSCFANAHSRSQVATSIQLESQLHRVQHENAHLRRPLGLTQVDGEETFREARVGSPQYQPYKSHNSSYHHFSSTHSNDPHAQNPAAIDLITFESNESSPLTSTNFQSPTESFRSDVEAYRPFVPSSTNTSFASVDSDPTDKPVPIESTGRKAVGLAIFSLERSEISNDRPVRGVHEAFEHLPAGGILQSGNNISRMALSPKNSLASKGQWQAIRSPPPEDPELVFETRFLDPEHNRLLNSACFIEEMTGEEREQHWMKLGREKERHSAREWKLYYEKVVRPLFLARPKTVEDTEIVSSDTTSPDDSVATDQVECIDKSAKRLSEGEVIQSIDISTREAGLRDPPSGNIGDIFVSRTLQNFDQLSVNALPASLTITDNLTTDVQQQNQIKVCEQNSSSDERTSWTQVTREPELLAVPTSSNCVDDSDYGKKLSSALTDLRRPATALTLDHSFTANSPPDRSQASTPWHQPSLFSRFPTEKGHIFYKPEVEDSLCFRTILISNVVRGVTLAQIVSAVCGGPIVKAQFLGTRGMKTIPPMNTNTAMIEFVTAEDAATALENWNAERTASESTQDGVQSFAPTLIRTPTRPLHPKLEFDMRSRSLTRVLYIAHDGKEWTPEKAMEEIMHCNKWQKRPLVSGQLDEGLLFFEFADVRDAALAWETIDRDQWCFRGVKKGFLPDPCSEAHDEPNGEREDSSGSDVDDEGDGGSTAIETPAASFEADDAGVQGTRADEV